MNDHTMAETKSILRTAFVASLIMLVCAVAIIVALAGRPAHGLSVPRGSHLVNVDEYDFGFRLASTTIPSGNVIFVDTNRGKIPHELVLFKADNAATKMPLRKDKSVDEESSALEDDADSGSSLAPGETRVVSASLDPGHYVLVCNLPGHYQSGMRVDINVR